MFLKYSQSQNKEIFIGQNKTILSFTTENESNLDETTVSSFGEEWLKFNSFTEKEIKIVGDQYFDIVDKSILTNESFVLDIGCGSGRWTKYVANKVKVVEAVDPSEAVITASKLIGDLPNVRITQASVSNIPFEDESFDFIICLGVLHHIPDTQQALIDLCKKLKPNGHILLYLYYSLDNRGTIYKFIFNTSTLFRKIISKLPHTFKKIICDIIAIIIYMPFVGIVRFLFLCFGYKNWIKKIPLSYYSDKSFNIIRNDALDRFGTPLEQRFSKDEIMVMLKKAGISNATFSNNEPYWHVLGKKS
jgi:2-polyprenyl-3-methyl-5-hydroxy-6-metoxy-1,4-benzoquinol methylase